MGVPAFTATLLPTMRSVSSLVVNGAPGALFDETLSIIRTRKVVPAGMVIVVADAERPVGLGIGTGDAVGAGASLLDVKVRAVTCEVSMTCSPASFLKRSVEAVPPRYF